MQALELAGSVEAMNKERRQVENESLEFVSAECERLVEKGDQGLVVYGAFHPGVIGIIASRVVERYHRPVFILTDDSSEANRIKGSGRSIDGVNLYEVLEACTDTIIQFGGHRMAAGFEVGPGHLEAFTEDFRRLARSGLTLEDLERELRIDACVTPGLLRHAGEDLIGALELLEPHGQGNPEPVLALLGVEFVSARQVGADKRHLKGTVMSGGHTLDVIGFGMGAMAPGLARAKGLYDIAFQPVVDEWAERRRLQLRLVDMRPAAAAAEVAGG